DNYARPLSFHTQSDVSRTSDLHVGPHADILVLDRTCHIHWPCILVPSARAARRSSAGEDIWRRIRCLPSAGEAMDSRSFVNFRNPARQMPLAPVRTWMAQLVTMDTITLKGGRVQQTSFKDFTPPRIADAPLSRRRQCFLSLVVCQARASRQLPQAQKA